MRIEHFDFDLPPDLIAQRPATPRDAARLLRISAEGIADLLVRDLPSLLGPGDLLVFNDTRVIPARLGAKRDAVAVSLTLHQQLGPDCWSVLARPAKRLRIGDELSLGDDFTAVVTAKEGGIVTLVFDRAGGDLIQAIERHGRMPLPPYIRGGRADDRDKADYQTMFAAEDGAVAAPTAALHFTPDLIAALERRGVMTARLTLHVGGGTFLPVKASDSDYHVMHSENGTMPPDCAEAINRCRRAGGRVVAVGTTSLRLIETAADQDGHVVPWSGATSIFITPGYRFRAVDLLLTNFHLPRSTLFMLVAAFAGLSHIRAAYAHAIAAGYRFYSYGDCCLIEQHAA